MRTWGENNHTAYMHTRTHNKRSVTQRTDDAGGAKGGAGLRDDAVDGGDGGAALAPERHGPRHQHAGGGGVLCACMCMCVCGLLCGESDGRWKEKGGGQVV